MKILNICWPFSRLIVSFPLIYHHLTLTALSVRNYLAYMSDYIVVQMRKALASLLPACGQVLIMAVFISARGKEIRLVPLEYGENNCLVHDHLSTDCEKLAPGRL